MISSMIKEMDFDGYVCGCGSQIYMNGELLFSSSNPNELCRETVERLRQCQMPAFFERPDKILYDGAAKDLPDAIAQLKVETAVEDLSLYSPEVYHTFTFDKFLAFPFLAQIQKLSVHLQTSISPASYMKTQPGN